MSRGRNQFAVWLIGAVVAAPAWAQYPGHIDTSAPTAATHLRATAVLEYTGDLASIKESRLVPIAVWDGVQYQPGGLYLAQPAPLAVLSGTQYELESDGKSQGYFNVKDAEDLAGLWIGVGSFAAPPAPASAHPKAPNGHAYVVKDVDPDKPHFAHVPEGDNPDGSSKNPPSQPDNGPTLHSRPSGDSSPSSGTNTAPAHPTDVDPDRPTFHHRAETAQTGGGGEGAPDPNRPHLTYTAPSSQENLAKPDALFGLPPDMKQIAGVSDSNAIDTQSFTYSWASPDDAQKMQSALETAAQQAVAPPAPQPAKTKRAHVTPRRKTQPPAPPALADEEFHAYGLTFGGGATMVFTAHTTATPEQYVTIVAQPDFYGNAQILFKQVANADNLDVTPRMLLVDAVDTEGNGRGDLIFELRGQTYRQFAIYRVANGQAAQAFVTQPTSLTP